MRRIVSIILVFILAIMNCSYVFAQENSINEEYKHFDTYEYLNSLGDVNVVETEDSTEYNMVFNTGETSIISEKTGKDGSKIYNVYEKNLHNEVIICRDGTIFLDGKKVVINTEMKTQINDLVTSRAQGTWNYSESYIDGISTFNRDVSVMEYDVNLQNNWNNLTLGVLTLIIGPFCPQLATLTALFGLAMSNYRTVMIQNEPDSTYAYVEIDTDRYAGSANPQYYIYRNTFYQGKNSSGEYTNSVGTYNSYGRLTYH